MKLNTRYCLLFGRERGRERERVIFNNPMIILWRYLSYFPERVGTMCCERVVSLFFFVCVSLLHFIQALILYINMVYIKMSLIRFYPF